MVRNFDNIYEYDDLFSNKWSFREEKTHEKDILPMWVADMDFETAPAVKAAVKKRADTAVYGYTSETKDYSEAVCRWFSGRYGWHFSAEAIVHTPGIASALVIGLHSFSKETDGVLILTPVYHKFFQVIRSTKRTVIESRLTETAAGYEIDFADFENKIKKHQPKIFILCNPHNPVGKVFSEYELNRLAQICLAHNVMIFSDEIHGDLVFEDKKYIPLATLSENTADKILVFTAPSKSFNLAGLRSSNIIISNSKLREKFKSTLELFGYPKINLFALPATIAAYTQGENWLHDVLKYIEGNRDFALQYLREHLPDLKAHKPQGTYFLWIDFRAYKWSTEQLEDFLLHTAKVWVNQGRSFGENGAGFIRMNIACPRSILEKALHRIEAALGNLQNNKK